MKLIVFLIICLIYVPIYARDHGKDKCRAVITTDLGGADPDDRQSLIHLLVSSDLIDIEGIISSQVWVTEADKTEHILNLLDAYGEAYANLKRHAKGFPTPEFLKSVTMRGQSQAGMAGTGHGKDSPGSELIVRLADRDDERPLWILAWGGMNTLAQAIQKVEQSRTDEETAAFLKKLRVYDVLGQDDAGAWIAKNYPDIFYIRNRDVYGWQKDDEWIRENIQSVLPLGAFYPDRIWAFEGDSPSFLYLLANGLNDPENVSYGGWGGRFDAMKHKNFPAMDWVSRNGMDETQYMDYYMFGSSAEGTESIRKWSDCIWNDFAARMIWASTPDYKRANHAPVININGDSRSVPLRITGGGGDEIHLDASRTKDPDKNNISFLWEVYPEAGLNIPVGNITGDNKSDKCHIKIRDNTPPGELHLILSVRDNGTPALVSCRRIVIEIKDTP